MTTYYLTKPRCVYQISSFQPPFDHPVQRTRRPGCMHIPRTSTGVLGLSALRDLRGCIRVGVRHIGKQPTFSSQSSICFFALPLFAPHLVHQLLPVLLLHEPSLLHYYCHDVFILCVPLQMPLSVCFSAASSVELVFSS